MTSSTDSVNWYALKVFFNKVFDIEKILQEDNIECYIPCEKTAIEIHGAKRIVRKPILPSLLFFRSSQPYAIELQRKLLSRVILYTKKTSEYTKIPAAIPEKEMQVFILVTSAGDQGLEYFTDDFLSYKVGQKVRITGGMFKGAEGYIKRIKHNRRLTVTLQGVCMVMTSFIPPCFIEKIEE